MLGWLPENVSTYGTDIDSLFALIYYITGVAFLLVEGLLLLFLLLYRRRQGHSATYVAGDRMGELAWILVPCALVLMLDLWIDARGVETWEKVKGSAPPADVRVRVVGKQFNWEVFYPGPDGEWGTADDRRLENELHVPVGKVVEVLLESQDVIHSFFLPHLRLKQDAVPGRKIPAWFVATKPGRYEIPCAELCGFGHSGMKGWLTVHTSEEYSAWVQRQWAALPPTPAGSSAVPRLARTQDATPAEERGS